MANRPVFVWTDKFPWYKKVDVSFTWNSGFSLAQKQKNILAIHENFTSRFPDTPILEVSDKNELELGQRLSMNRLTMKAPDQQSYVIENLFYSSQVFEHGGPYLEYLTDTPEDWKAERKLHMSGPLVGYCLFEEDYPLKPQNVFFDYLYFKGLLDNPELAEELCSYDAFSDIEFNPEKSLTCQAKAAALFVSISRAEKLDECRDFESFYSLMTGSAYPGPNFVHPASSWVEITPEEEEALKAQEKANKSKKKDEGQEEEKKREYTLPPRPEFPELPIGTRIHHDKFGDGEVIDSIDVKMDKRLTILFEEQGEKKFSWPAILIGGYVSILDD